MAMYDKFTGLCKIYIKVIDIMTCDTFFSMGIV